MSVCSRDEDQPDIEQKEVKWIRAGKRFRCIVFSKDFLSGISVTEMKRRKCLNSGGERGI